MDLLKWFRRKQKTKPPPTHPIPLIGVLVRPDDMEPQTYMRREGTIVAFGRTIPDGLNVGDRVLYYAGGSRSECMDDSVGDYHLVHADAIKAILPPKAPSL